MPKVRRHRRAGGMLPLACAVCRSLFEVTAQSGTPGLAFCEDCRYAARRPLADIELGGEG